MMLTIAALLLICLSALLAMSSLKMVARDTVEAVSNAARRARTNGELAQRGAFVGLWTMIFLLSYL